MQSFFMFLAAIGVCAALFFGFIKFMGKSMKPSQYDSQDSSLQDEQSQRAEEIRKKQKLLMEEREQRMREHRDRF